MTTSDLRPLLRRLIAAVARGGCEDDVQLIAEAQAMLVKLDRGVREATGVANAY